MKAFSLLWRKSLGHLLGVAVGWCVIGLAVAPGQTVGREGIWNYLDDGQEITLTGAAEPISGEWQMPAEINGKPVTKIAANAFAETPGLTGVHFHALIAVVGDGAFAGCADLSWVSFYGNAPQMGEGVFAGAAPGFTVFYYGGEGFSSPTWLGYNAVLQGGWQPPQIVKPTWEPGSGGALPPFPEIGTEPGVVGLLYVTKNCRVNKHFIWGNEHPTESIAELAFLPPSNKGASYYTVERSYNNADFQTLLDYNENPIQLTDDNFSYKPDGATYLRLRIHGGPLDGLVSNTVMVQPEVVESSFTGWSMDEGMYLTGIMTPWVGCGKSGSVTVQKLLPADSENLQPYVSYQWYRRNPNTFAMTPIEGATSGNYTTQPEDVGYQLVMQASGDGSKVGGYAQVVATGPMHALPAYAEGVNGNRFLLKLYQTLPGNYALTPGELELSYFMPDNYDPTPLEIVAVSPVSPGVYEIQTAASLSDLPDDVTFNLKTTSPFFALVMEMRFPGAQFPEWINFVEFDKNSQPEPTPTPSPTPSPTPTATPTVTPTPTPTASPTTTPVPTPVPTPVSARLEYNGVVGILGAMEPSAEENSIVGEMQQVNGTASLTINARGAYTIRVTTGGKTYSGRGVLPMDNYVEVVLTAGRGTQLQVNMDLVRDDLGLANYYRGVIFGDVQGDILLGARKYGARNPFPDAGSYTMDCPVVESSTQALDGTSVGTVSLSDAGVAKLAGFLADGTRFTCSFPVFGSTGAAEENVLLFYQDLYRRNGGVGGWMRQDEFGEWVGALYWKAPARANGGTARFAEGFEAGLEANLIPYERPAAGEPALENWPNAQGLAVFSGGGLVQDIFYDVRLSGNTKIVPAMTGENWLGLKVAVQIAQGTFSGTVRLPGIPTVAKFQGVLLPEEGLGVGYFLTPTGSGLLEIRPMESGFWQP